LYAGRNRHTDARTAGSVPDMSHFDIRVEGPQPDIPPVAAMRPDDDVPARRLLAHDLEPLVWDDDGERELPPPD
jgi:hypothetical protein